MKTVWIALRVLLVMTVITGLFYPLLMTGVAQLLFPEKADGSMIESGGKRIGSELIGQAFTSDKYFWPRPTAVNYNPLPSGGTNLGPASAVLRDSVQERSKRW